MTDQTRAGKTALVTGGTGGIGFHIAAALARLGMGVLVAGRDPDRAQAALIQLRSDAGHDDVHALLADGASIRENVRLAQEVERRVGDLDVLVNNVGGGASAERRETTEGLEHGLALNFAGPFALTTLLVPLLSRDGGGRIVNVVSSAYAMWTRDPLADVHSRGRYVWLEAHGHAKLLSLLATLALSRHLAASGIAINAVNPGMAWTPGTAALTPAAVPHWRFIWPVVRWVQRRASDARNTGPRAGHPRRRSRDDTSTDCARSVCRRVFWTPACRTR
jgi:NAD(P)-dependent dehydrogenase (short-subunit alcohol dehydrogenase family)